MANVIIKIEGTDQTVRRLNMFDMQKKKDTQTVVRKYTNAVRKEAKRRVPVSPANRKKSSGSPGDLKNSIRAKYYFQGLGSMILPHRPKGSHRGIIEAGTSVRTNKKGANRGRVKATPFMEPAKRSQEAGYNAAMKRIFEGEETEI